ncbi:MAG: hypothetical protein DRJ98_00710 [Thermoprotei archaeon]|nr:MAG: hypothetical protein DRJ98_00710 [Thermoprotei archaeon]
MLSRIGVYATRAKDYYEIISELRRLNLDFVSLDPDSPLPKEIKVVLVAKEDALKMQGLNGVKVVEVKDKGISLLSARIRLALQGRDKFGELIVGIDPGETYGLAVVADSALIDYRVFREVDDLLNYVKDVVEAKLAVRTLLRIGDGSPKHRDKVLSTFSIGLEGVEVEVVDEALASLTSIPSLDPPIPKDAASALHIALKEGHRVKGGLHV